MVDRIEGTANANPTPLGYVPTRQSLDVDGLDIDPENLDLLLQVDPQAVRWLSCFHACLVGLIVNLTRLSCFRFLSAWCTWGWFWSRLRSGLLFSPCRG